MNEALKVADIEDNSFELDSNEETQVDKLSNLDTDAIRAKIKAARLEKLMARQLESELSIELDGEPELTIAETEIADVEEDSIPIIETPVDEAPIDIDMPASKTRGYSAGSSKRMRNIQSTRHYCDEMVVRIRSGSELLTGLNEQTTHLVKQLQFMEQEFARIEEAEAKASKLAVEHKRVTGEYEEALNLIEKQNRQLDVLEAQRANSNINYENTKVELEKLQLQHQREGELFAESQMANLELEQDNRNLTSKLNSSELIISDLSSDLQTTNSSLKQKDMEAAKAQAELASAKERLTNAEASLETTSEELETVSQKLADKEVEAQNFQSQLTSAEEKLSTTTVNLEAATKELDSLTTEVHDKDMICAKLTSDYSSLIKSNTKVINDLDNVQNKYDDLNKSALEQQSQQYARIHELESTLRDTKRQLELKSKANAELTVELEATNNLLVLHEEMVAALSPEDRSKKK